MTLSVRTSHFKHAASTWIEFRNASLHPDQPQNVEIVTTEPEELKKPER